MHQRNSTRLFWLDCRGFTLLELLITVGIITLLTALALPAILTIRKRGIETRTRSDLGLISLALEAYKSDFLDFPRFDDSNDVDATAAGFSADPLNIQQDRGARLLCRALISPAPATFTVTGTTLGFDGQNKTEQAPDGADGPGFRVRTAGAGKVSGPYLDSTKFKIGNPAAPLVNGIPAWDSATYKDAELLDQNGNPILYYPGLTSAQVASSYISYAGPPGSSSGSPTRVFYNAFDNNHYGSSPAATPPTTPTAGNFVLFWKQMAYIMGDRDVNGTIGMYTDKDGQMRQEQPSSTLPYLLWTAGSDGIFGFGPTSAPLDPTSAAVSQSQLKTDDIANFDIPSDLRK